MAAGFVVASCCIDVSLILVYDTAHFCHVDAIIILCNMEVDTVACRQFRTSRFARFHNSVLHQRLSVDTISDLTKVYTVSDRTGELNAGDV